jgi:hypothetical protein
MPSNDRRLNGEPLMPEPPELTAQISYLLSDKGRKDSLRQGGDGKLVQRVTGRINEADVDAFDIDDDGNLSFDLTPTTIEFACAFNVPDILPAHKAEFTKEFRIVWNVVPAWDDLVEIVKRFKSEFDIQDAAFQESEKRKAQITTAFLADPKARATKLLRTMVQIDGAWFSEGEAAYDEARRRFADDQDALKQANRATLHDWITVHGSDNQRQRAWAGLLPWKEAAETAESYLFRPLDEFPLYKRFEVSEVCGCFPETCELKFTTIDAEELTAEEWEQLTRIKSVVPAAQFQLREHRAQCETVKEPVIRRGVIVKFTLGRLPFRREYALTIESKESKS